jgi:hypothetical protein
MDRQARHLDAARSRDHDPLSRLPSDRRARLSPVRARPILRPATRRAERLTAGLVERIRDIQHTSDVVADQRPAARVTMAAMPAPVPITLEHGRTQATVPRVRVDRRPRSTVLALDRVHGAASAARRRATREARFQHGRTLPPGTAILSTALSPVLGSTLESLSDPVFSARLFTGSASARSAESRRAAAARPAHRRCDGRRRRARRASEAEPSPSTRTRPQSRAPPTTSTTLASPPSAASH